MNQVLVLEVDRVNARVASSRPVCGAVPSQVQDRGPTATLENVSPKTQQDAALERLVRMSKFIVSIPIVGAIHIEVTAETEQQARNIAWQAITEEGEDAGEVEWEFLDRVTEGNVCHAPLNEIEVSKVR